MNDANNQLDELLGGEDADSPIRFAEQERPRTEVETFVALWEVIQDRYARPAVRRIVEEALEAARTEGRQQAVREIREEWESGFDTPSRLTRILDRVAGNR